jgi:hypothetical protein
MRQPGILLIILAGSLFGEDGQRVPRPGWPCVAGRAVDPGYLEASEGTGGQLFLFQRSEVAQASLVMSASYTHPATVMRAVGNLSGTREFEFPVDSSVESLLVLASLQCRNSIRVSRPNGSELTAANSAQSVDLQAGRILRVDSPEPGKWSVRLTGTGLYVLSVLARTNITLAGVTFSAAGDESLERPSRLPSPLPGVRQTLAAPLSGEAAHVRFQVVGPAGDPVSDLDTPEPAATGEYRIQFTPPAERFRIRVTGTDPTGWPFQRTHPVLFRTEALR